jgi:glutamyl-tRNA synthetase
MTNEIRVRIAPSPTGYLHIGTARTALFNFLFAKKYGGKFLLRIEDTDVARNSESSYNSILNGLKFLGLNWDDEVVYQSKRMIEHLQMAEKLIKNGAAYYCYLSLEEIAKRREEAEKNGTRYIHKHSPQDEIPAKGVNPVIRMKVPRNQDIINNDLVQGEVVINTETIEDFVIIRSDKTPVYMLSVVCDDIYMNITHIIRGDDHLTNTPKQILIYNGLNADLPKFAHIPLIHGADGKKLSKRHGALAVEDYHQMGYLPQSLRSYLVRLGWGSENDNILTDKEMINEFSLEGISRAPAKFDFEKLNNINHHFINAIPVSDVIKEFKEFSNKERLERAINKIRYRYFKITEMKEDFKAFEDNFEITTDARNIIKENTEVLAICLEFLKLTQNMLSIEADFKLFLKERGVALNKAFPALRSVLIGKISSIGVFEIIYILGLEEAIRRIEVFIPN